MMFFKVDENGMINKDAEINVVICGDDMNEHYIEIDNYADLKDIDLKEELTELINDGACNNNGLVEVWEFEHGESVGAYSIADFDTIDELTNAIEEMIKEFAFE